MNQILSTPNKINNNNRNKKPIDIKKILIFFAIAIIIFGVVIAGFKIYNLYSKKKEVAKVVEPEISIIQEENKVKIVVNHQEGIEKVEYYWEENDVNEINGNGKKTIEKKIDLLQGENTITIKVIDMKGNVKKVKKKFEYLAEDGKPKIEIGLVDENNKVTIIATDDKQIDYLVYYFEGEEETKVYATEENPLKIETEVTIKRGKHNLVVQAVDSQKNITQVVQPYEGIVNPEIDVFKENGVLFITVEHDLGLEKVDFTINGKIYTYSVDNPGYEKEKAKLEYSINLIQGENTIIIDATSNEGSNLLKQFKTQI